MPLRVDIFPVRRETSQRNPCSRNNMCSLRARLSPPLAADRLSYRRLGRDPCIYLSFRSDAPPSASDTARPNVTTVIRVTLEDSSGREVRSLELPLAKAIWRWSQGVFGAYDLDKSVFHFDPSASYVLRVSYTQGSTPPPAKEVYFEIDDCAYY